MHDEKFLLEKAYIGGESFDLIAEGKVDLPAQKMNLVALIAPFSSGIFRLWGRSWAAH